MATDFIARFGRKARALELRYLARRSFQMKDRGLAIHLASEAVRTRPALLVTEPVKTWSTLLACAVLRLLPERQFTALMRCANPSLA